MQRKSIIAPIIALLALTGVVWANSIFPDRADIGFSAFPTGPGTIGGALTSWFDIVTGTAKDGAALDGQPATGYLQGSNCAPDEVWKGIDTSGKAICKGPPLMLAEIYEGTMRVNGVIQPIGTRLREGDRIETDATQTGTIRFTHNPSSISFTPSDSIARLGTSTRVYIDRGDALGTLALVNLEDGLLWGRVLSSTGIDFGGGGLIAGVRGTSIALEKVAGQPLIRMIIPHSQSATDAATLSLANSTSTNRQTMARSTAMYYNSGTNTAVVTLNNTISTKPLSYLYDTGYIDRLGLSKWIRENTVQDLTYLRTLTQSMSIQAEIAATEPDPIADRRGVCGSVAERDTNNGIWYKGAHECVYGYADYMNATQDTILYTGNKSIPMQNRFTNTEIKLKDDGWVFGYDCGGSNANISNTTDKLTQRALYFNKYMSIDDLLNKSTLNQNTSSLPLALYDGSPKYPDARQTLTTLKNTGVTRIKVTGATTCSNLAADEFMYNIEQESPAPTIAGGGILIDEIGESISYPLDGLNLAGKTITITTNGPGIVDKYLADFGTISYKINSLGATCLPTTSLCPNAIYDATNKTYTIQLLFGIIPEKFIIGNNYFYNKPISTTIKGITIK